MRLSFCNFKCTSWLKSCSTNTREEEWQSGQFSSRPFMWIDRHGALKLKQNQTTIQLWASAVTPGGGGGGELDWQQFNWHAAEKEFLENNSCTNVNTSFIASIVGSTVLTFVSHLWHSTLSLRRFVRSAEWLRVCFLLFPKSNCNRSGRRFPPPWMALGESQIDWNYYPHFCLGPLCI